MSDEAIVKQLCERTNQTLSKLRGLHAEEEIRDAKRLVEELRNFGQYEAMGQVAEAVSRVDPKDPKNRRLYAQSLIETCKATVAIDVLQSLIRRLPKQHDELFEATGLLGRAHKQIFFDTADKTSASARASLKRAIAAYRKPFDEDPRKTWHGVNLLALLASARRLGVRVAQELHPTEIAKKLVATLEATPEGSRNEWFCPTLAEAYLGLEDWDAVERNVKAYATGSATNVFQIRSTLRQFTQIWDLEGQDVNERGRALISILRARLLQLPDGEMALGPDDLQRLREQPRPDDAQLEAVLGKQGPQTFRWWKTGLDRALSVCAVYQRLGSRVGTGFLVRAGDCGLAPADELLVMTNFHVVNQAGVSPGVRPEEAEIVFEAVDPSRRYSVQEIRWSSPPRLHDAALLRLQPSVVDIEPLPVARALPVLEEPPARVYIIGHPGGHDLAYSFQDNALLDHEGPPNGQPPLADVCRVHYAAPTEGGSSGSPVFNARLWEVIALHHMGGTVGMPKLNGKPGMYAANEGISIQSIAAATKP